MIADLARSPEDQSPVERALRDLIVASSRPDLSSAPGVDVQYTVENLSVGRLLIATRADGTLLASAFVRDDRHEEALLDRLADTVSPRVLRGGDGPARALGQLQEYLNGARQRFELAVDLSLATPFQRTVLSRLAGIVGYGRTASYREVAEAIGRPTAARAVGAALGSNPLCVVMPCHRVIASSGRPSGYAGGVDAKRALLTLEQTVSQVRTESGE
jgi:methylated-DNA-[protein]-cysteine S-methyltransferase